MTRVAGLVLLHGAGSGPWVFEDWPDAFPGLEVVAVDLQDALEVTRASSLDYAEQVVRAASTLRMPVALCGWSTGGLAALQAAAAVAAEAVVLVESSPPGEVQGFDEQVELVEGAFDPEEVYGPFPPGMRGRPESSLARAERKRGVSVPALACRSLVVSGCSFPLERGARLAAQYGSDTLAFPELDHWQLVVDPRVRAAISAWLEPASPAA